MAKKHRHQHTNRRKAAFTVPATRIKLGRQDIDLVSFVVATLHRLADMLEAWLRRVWPPENQWHTGLHIPYAMRDWAIGHAWRRCESLPGRRKPAWRI